MARPEGFEPPTTGFEAPVARVTGLSPIESPGDGRKTQKAAPGIANDARRALGRVAPRRPSLNSDPWFPFALSQGTRANIYSDRWTVKNYFRAKCSMWNN